MWLTLFELAPSFVSMFDCTCMWACLTLFEFGPSFVNMLDCTWATTLERLHLSLARSFVSLFEHIEHGPIICEYVWQYSSLARSFVNMLSAWPHHLWVGVCLATLELGPNISHVFHLSLAPSSVNMFDYIWVSNGIICEFIWIYSSLAIWVRWLYLNLAPAPPFVCVFDYIWAWPPLCEYVWLHMRLAPSFVIMFDCTELHHPVTALGSLGLGSVLLRGSAAHFFVLVTDF